MTHDVIVIGAGQGGLSASYCLTDAGIEHQVLDRGGIAHAWRAERWDSFCLVTPNWTIRLPGAEYDGPDPDGFMSRDDFVDYMIDWATGFGAPVRAGVDVQRLRYDGSRFDLETNASKLSARVVIVATATYQHERIPALAAQIPADIDCLHAAKYKSPKALPAGAVLVVGSGQTGCQVVDDLLRSGRKVFQCVGRAGRLPRRYRGRDSLEWQKDMQLLERTPDMLESPALRFAGDPHVSGRDGGMTLSLHDFHRRGVTLLGRLEAVVGRDLHLSPTLTTDMQRADDFATDFMKRIDDHITESGHSAPAPTEQELSGGPDEQNWSIPEPESLHLEDAGIRSIIWATGFQYDFSWIDPHVLDDAGYPQTDRGVSAVPGLYFCGLNWMYKRKSGILFGVGEDARYVVNHVAKFLDKSPRSTEDNN